MSSDELPHRTSSRFFVFYDTFSSHRTNTNFFRNKTANFSSLSNVTFLVYSSVVCVFFLSFLPFSLAAPFGAPFDHEGAPFKTEGAPFKTEVAPFDHESAPFDRNEGVRSIEEPRISFLSVTNRINDAKRVINTDYGNTDNGNTADSLRVSGYGGEEKIDASFRSRPDLPERRLRHDGAGLYDNVYSGESEDNVESENIRANASLFEWTGLDDDDDVSGEGEYVDNDDNDDDEEVARVFSRLLSTSTASPASPMTGKWENDDDGEEAGRMRRAVTQALCPIKQGKHGEDEIAQLTKSTCTQTIAQSMCEEDERMELRRNEIRPLGESRSAAVYYGHELCFSFFSRGATKTDGCMSMCMEKDKKYEVSLDVSGYTRTYWTLKFTGDCYFCGFSQPLTVVLCVFLSIVVIAATCCVCCRTDPSRQLSTMHQAMQQQMQKIVNSRNAAAEEVKNPPYDDVAEGDPGAETQGDITMDNDNLDATRDNDNLDMTRDDDNLDATRDTRSRGSPTGTRPSPSMQSRSEAVTPSAPVADDSRLFDESKDWTDREC